MGEQSDTVAVLAALGVIVAGAWYFLIRKPATGTVTIGGTTYETTNQPNCPNGVAVNPCGHLLGMPLQLCLLGRDFLGGMLDPCLPAPTPSTNPAGTNGSGVGSTGTVNSGGNTTGSQGSTPTSAGLDAGGTPAGWASGAVGKFPQFYPDNPSKPVTAETIVAKLNNNQCLADIEIKWAELNDPTLHTLVLHKACSDPSQWSAAHVAMLEASVKAGDANSSSALTALNQYYLSQGRTVNGIGSTGADAGIGVGAIDIRDWETIYGSLAATPASVRFAKMGFTPDASKCTARSWAEWKAMVDEAFQVGHDAGVNPMLSHCAVKYEHVDPESVDAYDWACMGFHWGVQLDTQLQSAYAGRTSMEVFGTCRWPDSAYEVLR